MKYIILILIMSLNCFAVFEDTVWLSFRYTGLLRKDAHLMGNTTIPEPSFTSYLVDNENIENTVTGTGGMIKFLVKPIDSNGVREMYYYDDPYLYTDGHMTFKMYFIYNQFGHVDSSWGEMVDDNLVVNIWPRVELGSLWCTSLVIEHANNKTWDDFLTVGEQMNFTHVIYNGLDTSVVPYIAIGYAEIYNVKLYDREAYEDSLRSIDVVNITNSKKLADFNISRPYDILGRQVYNRHGRIRRIYK